MSETLIKYPRTPHLPGSPGATSDDKWVSPEALQHFRSGIDLVVTEKMDGGNLTMYRNGFHARSLDSGVHPWDTRAKRLHESIRYEIPAGWRISGESMYARRSVGYSNLPGVFLVFGIWDETNTLLGFDSMVEWADLLGLPVVPVLYRGTNFDEALAAWSKQRNPQTSEGFVVRDAGRIHYEDFGLRVGKYVRANHVTTSASWRHRDDFDVNDFIG